MVTPEPPLGTIRFESNGYVSIAIESKPQDVSGPFLYPSGTRMAVKRAGQDTGGAGHCIKALRIKPPKTFDVTLEGSVCSGLSATVRLSRDAVTQLPLIDDLASSTASQTTQADSTLLNVPSPREYTTLFHPPCGIWALVALLQLLECGCEKGELGEAPDPALAGLTLQMADYMGASQVVALMCECFRDVFMSLKDGVAVPSKEYLLMVLWQFPDTFCKEVLTDQVPLGTACQKPDIAFAKWLQGAGKYIDLRPESSTFVFKKSRVPDITLQFLTTKILRCLANCEQVTELQVPASTFFPAAREICYKTPPCPVGARSLHIDRISLDEHDAFMSHPDPLGFLGRNLTTLSIDKIDIANCKPSCTAGGEHYRAAERWAFFRAIGKLPRLKTLRVSQQCWSDLIAYGVDVTAPLLQLEGLEVVDVADGGLIGQVVGGAGHLQLVPSYSMPES